MGAGWQFGVKDFRRQSCLCMMTMLSAPLSRRFLIQARCFSVSLSDIDTAAKLHRIREDGSENYVKRTADGRYQRPIFIAATRQHVGKTTTSLAIMSGLKKKFDKVGFLKPVSQINRRHQTPARHFP